METKSTKIFGGVYWELRDMYQIPLENYRGKFIMHALGIDNVELSNTIEELLQKYSPSELNAKLKSLTF